MKIPSYKIDQYILGIAKEKIAGALLFGPEESVIFNNYQIIAKKITPNLSDPFLVSNLTKERFVAEPTCLADEFYSLTMLGGRKLISIKDGDANLTNSLKSLLENGKEILKSENFILIVAGDLDKSSALRKICEESQYFAALACYEEDERQIKKFIENEFYQNNIELDKECAEYLFAKFGKNRQIISSEIKKIALYLDGEDLTIRLLKKIIDNQEKNSIDEFINSFVEKNTTKAISQAEYLLRNGFDSIALARFLANYLQKLYHVKIDIDVLQKDPESSIKNQKLFFKSEPIFRKNLKLITLENLINQLQELENIETKIKTSSSIPAKMVFENFLIKMLDK